MSFIKKGDKVIVLSGKDKGKNGKVLHILAEKQRVMVENIGLVKKHMKRRSESDTGGIKETPRSIHMSKVALFCNSCNKGVRVGIRQDGDSKIRICKKCNQPIQ